jgi:hypothetical protein
MLLALRRSLRLKAKRCAFAAPKGEARRIRSANKKFSRIFAALRLLAENGSQRQQYWRSIRNTKE